MKKIQLLTSIILTLLMIIAPQSIALAADDSSQASAVSLISDGFSVDKKAIYAGDTFKLKYKIKNTNTKLDVKNLNMALIGRRYIYRCKRRGYHLFPFPFKRCKRTV